MTVRSVGGGTRRAACALIDRPIRYPKCLLPTLPAEFWRILPALFDAFDAKMVGLIRVRSLNRRKLPQCSCLRRSIRRFRDATENGGFLSASSMDRLDFYRSQPIALAGRTQSCLSLDWA